MSPSNLLDRAISKVAEATNSTPAQVADRLCQKDSFTWLPLREAEKSLSA